MNLNVKNQKRKENILRKNAELVIRKYYEKGPSALDNFILKIMTIDDTNELLNSKNYLLESYDKIKKENPYCY